MDGFMDGWIYGCMYVWMDGFGATTKHNTTQHNTTQPVQQHNVTWGQEQFRESIDTGMPRATQSKTGDMPFFFLGSLERTIVLENVAKVTIDNIFCVKNNVIILIVEGD
jgi:hypothetical protein